MKVNLKGLKFGGLPLMMHEKRLVYKRPTRYVMGTDAVSGNFLARSGGYTGASASTTGGAVFRGGCVGGCSRRRRRKKGKGFIALGRGFLPIGTH